MDRNSFVETMDRNQSNKQGNETNKPSVEFILFSLGISREKCPLPRGVVEGRKRGEGTWGGRQWMGQGMAVE